MLDAVAAAEGGETDGDAHEAAVTRRLRGKQDATDVEAVLAGDASAFESLVRRHSRKALVVSFRLLGNHEDARDVVQNAMLKAYRSLDTLDRPAAFGGWLMRIVTNLSLNHRRGRGLRMTQPIHGPVGDSLGSPTATDRPMRGQNPDSFSRTGDPHRLLEGRELGDELRKAINQLPERQRDALLMFTVEDVPQKEVAGRLGCSVEAVKWHVFQGRKKLRELLSHLT